MKNSRKKKGKKGEIEIESGKKMRAKEAGGDEQIHIYKCTYVH